jgi:hypothetical protein
VLLGLASADFSENQVSADKKAFLICLPDSGREEISGKLQKLVF